MLQGRKRYCKAEKDTANRRRKKTAKPGGNTVNSKGRNTAKYEKITENSREITIANSRGRNTLGPKDHNFHSAISLKVFPCTPTPALPA